MTVSNPESLPDAPMTVTLGYSMPPPAEMVPSTAVTWL